MKVFNRKAELASAFPVYNHSVSIYFIKFIGRNQKIYEMKKRLLNLFTSLFIGSAAIAQPFNNVLKLDGTNDYAEYTPALVPASSDFTIETYFNLCNISSSPFIFDSRGSTAGDGIQIRFNAGSLDISIEHSTAGSNQKMITNNAKDNIWYHLAVTHNVSDSMCYIYLNGVLLDSLKGLITPFPKFTVGKADFTTSGYFKGYMDEFRISDTIRYSGNFTVPTSAFANDNRTIALWHFDETEGSSAFNDASTNNYDLTGYIGAETRTPFTGASAGANVKVCLGDTVQITATGGDSYTWTPNTYLQCDTCDTTNAYPINTKDYIVMIYKDSLPCPISDTLTVTVDSIPNIYIGGDTALCIGQSATLNVMGSVSSYAWSTGATTSSIVVSPTTNSNYFVVGTDGNTCSDSAFYTLAVVAWPDTSVSGGGVGIPILSNDTTPGMVYQWIDCGNGNTPISGATTRTLSPTTTGSYAVILSNGYCSDTSRCVIFTYWSINEYTTNNYTVYPNPAADEVKITLNAFTGNLKFTINNSIGEIIKTGYITGAIQNITLGDIPNGVYMLSIEGTKSKLITVIK